MDRTLGTDRGQRLLGQWVSLLCVCCVEFQRRAAFQKTTDLIIYASQSLEKTDRKQACFHLEPSPNSVLTRFLSQRVRAVHVTIAQVPVTYVKAEIKTSLCPEHSLVEASHPVLYSL